MHTIKHKTNSPEVLELNLERQVQASPQCTNSEADNTREGWNLDVSRQSSCPILLSPKRRQENAIKAYETCR
jgi:hypothetical protein